MLSDPLQKKKRMEISISFWSKRRENDVIISIDWQLFCRYVLFGIPSYEEADFHFLPHQTLCLRTGVTVQNIPSAKIYPQYVLA